MKYLTPLFLAAALLSAAPAAAQDLNARDAAARIAEVVEENYFDAARGRAIADELRQRAESGSFDRYDNPHDIATAIGAVLEPHDTHFNVTWGSPETNTAPAGNPQRAFQRFAAAGARANYGFTRVEMLPGQIGLITLNQFAGFNPAQADAPARRAADAAMALVASAEAVIVDLRGNGGGSPAMVAYLASHFVPAGADIFNTFHSRQGTSLEAPVIDPTGARRLQVQLYILISARTGSAAESFAYTLQAAGRATIIGEASAGGANPGGFLRTPEGFTVFVSAGTPINPITGRNWEGTGVIPDVAAAAADALVRAQSLALEARVTAETDEDARTEARWALDALGAHSALSPRELRAYAGDYGDRTVVLEGARLVLRQGRRPPVALTPLERDLFVSEANPLSRVRFDRDARGRVVALMQLSPTGDPSRHLRTDAS